MMVGRIGRMALCLAVLATCTPALDVSAQDFDWNGQMGDGETLIVRGISGDVRATLARGDVAEVVATKKGRSSDFDDVSIEVFEERGTTIVCVIYDSRRGNADCEGRGNDEHRGDQDRDIRVSVDFEVQVPAGVHFEGRTVSGDVEARGLRADVAAHTVSGDVDVSTTGVARGGTVSGSVDIEMGSLDWGSLEFSTVSGDIRISVPAGLDADVDFESLTGDFDSDFSVDIERQRSRFIGSALSGTIGDGGRRLSFHTVSGDVELLRVRRDIR
jgi:DUF4097 and DUF4098 domain-containing protein YvlB